VVAVAARSCCYQHPNRAWNKNVSRAFVQAHRCLSTKGTTPFPDTAFDEFLNSDEDLLSDEDLDPSVLQEILDSEGDATTLQSVMHSHEQSMPVTEANDTDGQTIREKYLSRALQHNLAPQFTKIRGIIPKPQQVSNEGFMLLKGRERELYELHLSDSETWTVEALGLKYKITQARAKGVIMLQALYDERVASGYFERQIDPLYEAYKEGRLRIDMSEFSAAGTKSGLPDSEEANTPLEGITETDEKSDNADNNADMGGDEPSAKETSQIEASDFESNEGPATPRDEAMKLKRELAIKFGSLFKGNDSEDEDEITSKDLRFFDKHGYFADELQYRDRVRVDADHSSQLTHFQDDQLLEDVPIPKKFEKHLRVPQVFPAKKHEVGKSVNFDDTAKYKRKVIFEDISSNRVDADAVKVLEHDGSLRTAKPEDLRQRYQIKQSRRQRQ
jgi:hypothetical protein